MATNTIYKLLTDAKKSANINNNNYNNNTNNNNNKITTSMIASLQEDSNLEEVVTASSLGSLREEESSSSLVKEKVTRKLPPTWRGIKLDLFRNGLNKDGTEMLKMNVTVIDKLNGSKIQLMAALNSSFDSSIRRGVEKPNWREESHWIRVRQHYKELKMRFDNIRTSKLGLKNKGRGTEITVFLYVNAGVWCVDLIREGEVYYLDLTDSVNELQKKGNIIASGYHGSKMQKLLTAKDLGI